MESEIETTTFIETLAGHPLLFMLLGGLMILLGLGAIAVPWTATLAATLLFGALLLAGGAVSLVHALRCRRGARGTLAQSLIAAVQLATGALLVLFPVAGVISLTLVLTALFLALGLFRLVQAAQARGRRGAGWMALGGALDLLLAALILVSWPGSALWLLGLLLGIDLIFSGTWTLLTAREARRGGPAAERGAPAPPGQALGHG